MIELKKVTKILNGNNILNNINLNLEIGKIYGLIGKNGSGKSILLKCIAKWINVTSGEIIYDKNLKIRALIEEPAFMEDLSGLQNIYLLNKDYINNCNEIEELFKFFNLEEVKNLNVSKYSLGMKQKLGIISVLIDNPDVIILDEPFNGLDESSVMLLRNILLKIKEKKIIIITSHVSEDIDILADEIIKLVDGKIDSKITNVNKSTNYINNNPLVEKKINNNKNNFLKLIFILISIIFIMTVIGINSYIIKSINKLNVAKEYFEKKEYKLAYSHSMQIPTIKVTKELKEKINFYHHYMILYNTIETQTYERKILSVYKGLLDIESVLKENKCQKKWQYDALYEIKEMYLEYSKKNLNISNDVWNNIFNEKDKEKANKLLMELMKKQNNE